MAASGASPAMLLSLVAIAIVAALLAIHPFVTYPVSLVILRRWCRPAGAPPTAPGPPPRVALCFCAYNEAGVIADKIANLRALSTRLPGLAIHCYVDGATDGTDRILAEVFQGDSSDAQEIAPPAQLSAGSLAREVKTGQGE